MTLQFFLLFLASPNDKKREKENMYSSINIFFYPKSFIHIKNTKHFFLIKTYTLKIYYKILFLGSMKYKQNNVQHVSKLFLSLVILCFWAVY